VQRLADPDVGVSAPANNVAVERTIVGVGVNKAMVDGGPTVAGTAVAGRLVAGAGVDTLPTCPQPAVVNKRAAIKVMR
jgi:hypothetical protein